ncbi:PD-(D/E)XK nuclease family transposase [Catalinimonas sp. 4WD22]|uniref:PD-(D/E)XK nuclease family transposase n=1 Tax=Catalinimonas locisalis TaxID=3133978 RepID=UPI003100AFD2
MHVLKNLRRLQKIHVKLKERIFKKLFSDAEIAKLKPEEMKAYEESLKTYRDQYSVIETARNEGKNEGREEEKIAIVKQMKKYGDPIEKISAITGLTKEEIEKL